MKLELSEAAIERIVKVLHNAPYRKAAPVLQEIAQQVQLAQQPGKANGGLPTQPLNQDTIGPTQ